MQTGSRQEIDGDFSENYVSFSDIKTDQNQFEISCGVCCKTFYADEVSYENTCRAIEQGLDNPFVCDDCQREYDELAYGNR